MLAISASDGKIKWGFQYTPQDPYDYDEISEHPIINAKVNGEDRKLVVHAARNGFFYALDRTNGSFVVGKQYVDQLTWTTGLDPKTGKSAQLRSELGHPDLLAPAATACAARAAGRTCPTNSGGKNWEPSAYNPELGLLYLPSSKAATSSRRSSRRTSPTRAAPSSRASASPAAAPRTPSAATAASRRSIRRPARQRSI